MIFQEGNTFFPLFYFSNCLLLLNTMFPSTIVSCACGSIFSSAEILNRFRSGTMMSANFPASNVPQLIFSKMTLRQSQTYMLLCFRKRYAHFRIPYIFSPLRVCYQVNTERELYPSRIGEARAKYAFAIRSLQNAGEHWHLAEMIHSMSNTTKND